jgi:queuine tRNA-ribosyltransferase
LGFDGFGIGGDLGKDKKTMKDILSWTIPNLDYKKPRHLLGIGYLEDMENIIKSGIDLFDCTVPTHYARRGIAFISSGKIDLDRSIFLRDRKPLDSKCSCDVCQNYKRNYISHLIRAKEITGMKLLTIHNLYFFNSFVEKIREKIKNNKI